MTTNSKLPSKKVLVPAAVIAVDPYAEFREDY
jgi:hypothetical protein